MPGYKGHLMGGAVTYCALLYGVTFYCAPTLLTGIEWFLFALAGSLFPDVDVKSKGQHYFYWIIFALFIYLVMLQRWKMVVFASFFAMLPLLVRHRGIFHRAWFIIFLVTMSAIAIGLYFPKHGQRLWLDALFFLAGALSHLWLDLGLRRMFRI